MAPRRKASLRGGMQMSVRSRFGSAVGSAVGGGVERGGAIGPAYRHFMTEQIVHIGKGARAADFG
jgi:hypothetical protein